MYPLRWLLIDCALGIHLKLTLDAPLCFQTPLPSAFLPSCTQNQIRPQLPARHPQLPTPVKRQKNQNLVLHQDMQQIHYCLMSVQENQSQDSSHHKSSIAGM